MKVDELEELKNNLVADLESQQKEAAQAKLSRLTVPQLADLLDMLDLDDAVSAFSLIDLERSAFVLTEVMPETQGYLLRHGDQEQICQILDELPMDDAADLIGGLENEEIEPILARLPALDAREVRDLLAYPEGTAGRMMTEKFAAVRREMTVAQTLTYLHGAPSDLETVNDIYVLTAEGNLIGVCSLRMIITEKPGKRIGDVMVTKIICVDGDTEARDVAKLVADYNFLAIPVVASNNKMLGIVTVDDVIDYLDAEYEKTLLHMAGADAEELDRKTPMQVAMMRVPWILTTLFIELFAGAVIKHFDETLRQLLLLASFMPVISAISGNTGLQSAAIIIRGLSSGTVDLTHWRQALRRQVVTTAILGAICGGVLGSVGTVWYKVDTPLAEWHKCISFGIVIFIGMFMSVNIAGFMGTIVPMVSKRLGFDPALTAGPFETAFQDVVGISIFLTLATSLLHLIR